MSQAEFLKQFVAKLNAEIPKNSGASTPARLERGLALREFFSALFEAILHMRADRAVFSLDAQALTLKITFPSYPEISCVLHRECFHHILAWFQDRVAFNADSDAGAGNAASSQKSIFAAIVRLGGRLMRVQVDHVATLSGKDSLTVSDVRAIDSKDLQNFLGILDHAASSYADLSRAPNGIIVGLCDEPHTRRALSYLQSAFDLLHAGDLAQAGITQALPRYAERALILVTQRGWDVLEGSCEAAQILGESLWKVTRGTVAVRFCRNICPGCGRLSLSDPAVLASLPAGLRPPSDREFTIGRGCERCGQSGSIGFEPLVSVLNFDAKLQSEIFSARDDRRAMYQYAYQRGAKPLLEEGVRKAIAGKCSISNVLDCIRTIPQGFAPLVEHAGPFAVQSTAKQSGAARGAERPVLTSTAAGEILRGVDVWSEDRPAPDQARKRSLPERPVVLVVEDDGDQRAILDMVLKSANYEVLLAPHGLAGLEMLAKRIPDLILTDLMMPQMDGREFVSRVKLDQRFRSIPLMVLTVISDSEKEYDLLALGADDYCEKTVQRKVLLQRIENLLRRAR